MKRARSWFYTLRFRVTIKNDTNGRSMYTRENIQLSTFNFQNRSGNGSIESWALRKEGCKLKPVPRRNFAFELQSPDSSLPA